MTTHLLYLHGFRSSPQSAKARQMAARVAADHPGVTWWCPQLPPSPAEAAALIERGTADWPAERMAVVGSSLGGFYATWMAERTGCKAVLLNPAAQGATRWLDGDYAAMTFAPAPNTLRPGDGPPHIRMDRAAEFLIGDRV